MVMHICKKCGAEKEVINFRTEPRMVLGHKNVCKECESLQHKEWVRSHKDEIKKSVKLHNDAHREEINEKSRERRRNNPERAKEIGRKSDLKHREKRRSEKKIWAQNNPDKVLIHKKTYRKNHHSQIIEDNRRREAIKRGAALGDPFTDLEICKRDKWICQICHEKVNWRLKKPNPMSKSIDHIIPISKGGEHSWRNCVLAHLRCNTSKGNRVISQQMRLF